MRGARTDDGHAEGENVKLQAELSTAEQEIKIRNTVEGEHRVSVYLLHGVWRLTNIPDQTGHDTGRGFTQLMADLCPRRPAGDLGDLGGSDVVIKNPVSSLLIGYQSRTMKASNSG